MKVVILGSGNVANVLSILIQKAGHQIVQVASRNRDHAAILASKYNADAVSLTEPEFASADIYVVALHDASLDSLEKIHGLKNKFVVHTAGSVSNRCFEKYFFSLWYSLSLANLIQNSGTTS